VEERNVDSEEGEAAMSAAAARVNDCAERIISTQVRGLPDLLLLAETLHWELWTDPTGITDANLAEGPKNMFNEESEAALAAPLNAIRDLTMAGSQQ
jgi:hypothetical protein